MLKNTYPRIVALTLAFVAPTSAAQPYTVRIAPDGKRAEVIERSTSATVRHIERSDRMYGLFSYGCVSDNGKVVAMGNTHFGGLLEIFDFRKGDRAEIRSLHCGGEPKITRFAPLSDTAPNVCIKDNQVFALVEDRLASLLMSYSTLSRFDIDGPAGYVDIAQVSRGDKLLRVDNDKAYVQTRVWGWCPWYVKPYVREIPLNGAKK